MNKLFYGSGECSIEGNASIVIIQYKGAVEIRDKTSKDYYINANDKTIVILPVRKPSVKLDRLFKYKGELIVTEVKSGGFGESVHLTYIKKFMDYSDTLNTNAEDLTTNSEDLRTTYKQDGNITKTRLVKGIIPNLHTNDGGNFFLDGEEYSGSYHMDIVTNKIMTGSNLTIDSKSLKRRK